MGDADAFAREVTTQAVAQAFTALGVNETFASVLDSLSDVTAHYIEAIGRMAHDSAERNGRSPSDVTLVDILSAIGQMPQHGGGVAWRDLADFAFGTGDSTDAGTSTGWGQPFPHSVPIFPISKEQAHVGDAPAAAPPPPFAAVQQAADSTAPPPAGVGNGAAAIPPPSQQQYIPPFLPPLPPAHTYSASVKRSKAGGVDPSGLRLERLKRKRQTEESLRKLTAASNGTGGGSAGASGGGSSAAFSGGVRFGELDIDATELPQQHRKKPPLQAQGAPGRSGSQILRLKPSRLADGGKTELILEGMYDDGGDADG
ncbi:hypothetical protein JKP88DRAFT_327846 [Tribonema minus]|uniref:Transcription initiation factor TFIID subunit 8 n=1 Tax=Tribonema minus TaxID=303371 RepID=A0A835YQ00_9STRA|nr:hypothetical protein JKP88DRAFT_327846 [Tribonema minus]